MNDTTVTETTGARQAEHVPREETVRVVSRDGTHYTVGAVQYHLKEGAYGEGQHVELLRDLIAQFADETGGSPMTTAEHRARRGESR